VISFEFFGILSISLILYWLLPAQRYRNLLLTASSLLFIWLLDHQSLIVVLALTLFSYGMGQIIYRQKRSGWAHALGIVGVLSSLIFFKYLGFLAGITDSLYTFLEALPRFSVHHLLLPLGISYIVLKHISYLTDIKWKLVKPGNFLDFLLYSSLFTIFLAGPIERFERLSPQLKSPRIPFKRSDLELGSQRIALGLFKKLVIADWIGFFIADIWRNPDQYHPGLAVLALFGYAIQIYFDFAGYSDIAIGSSRLFGLKVMGNFQRPYLAPNISQFWRRWHISLSDFIRDYIFFPLSRLSSSKLWLLGFVPVIAMALCGIWHGAESRYLLWGIWHGLGLTVYQLFQQFKRRRIKRKGQRLNASLAVLAWPVTFMFVSLGWLSFRAFGLPVARHIFFSAEGLLAILLSFLLLIFIGRAISAFQSRISAKVRWRPAFTLYLLLICLICYSAMNTEFIYAAF
jgi:alginate O-acetyltransferase complex protein AlgI